MKVRSIETGIESEISPELWEKVERKHLYEVVTEPTVPTEVQQKIEENKKK